MPRLPFAFVLAASATACGGNGTGSTAVDGGDSGTFVPCAGALADGGLSLATFPAVLCAEGDLAGASESHCESWTILQATGVDNTNFWVFDTTTGALAAFVDSTGAVIYCSAAAPAFRLPYACITGNLSSQSLCPRADAGPLADSEAVPPDSSTDAPID